MDGRVDALHLLLIMFLCEPAPELSNPKITQLVQQLGHDEFTKREKASEQLGDLKDVALPYLRVALKDKDLEIVQRARRVLDLTVEKQLVDLAPYPLIDSCWYNVKTRSYAPADFFWPGLGNLHDRLVPYLEAHGRDNAPWNNYRLATRDWARDMLLAGVRPQVIKMIFQELHERDKVFLNR